MNKIRYNVIIIVWIIQPLSHDDTNILRPNLHTRDLLIVPPVQTAEMKNWKIDVFIDSHLLIFVDQHGTAD